MVRVGVIVLFCVSLIWLALPAVAAEPQHQTVFPGVAKHSDALAQGKAEGRLLLCVCSGAGDRKMQRFMNRLKDEPKLRRLASHFVIDFVDADFQTPTVNDFNQVGKVDGEPPWVYIVVPIGSGKVIGAAADLSESDKIPEFLFNGLSRAGMTLSAKDAAKYAKAVEKAKAMIAADDPSQALAALMPASKARGYADSVGESRELWETIALKGKDELSQCEKLADDPSQLFAAAVLITEISHKYARIPEHKKAAEQLSTKIGKLKDGRTTLLQAQDIIKARNLIRAGKPEGAVTIYKRLIDKSAGSPAAEMAQKELEALADKPSPAKAAEKN